jgi:hypothetical protein
MIALIFALWLRNTLPETVCMLNNSAPCAQRFATHVLPSASSLKTSIAKCALMNAGSALMNAEKWLSSNEGDLVPFFKYIDQSKIPLKV